MSTPLPLLSLTEESVVVLLVAMVVVVAKAVVGGEGGSRWSRSWLMCSTPTGEDRMNEIGKIVVVHSDKCKWLKHSASRKYFLIVAAAGGLIL